MKLLRGQQPRLAPERETVVTVGNFDGVHLGHRQLLQGLLDYGQSHQLDTAVVLFEPQPREFFMGDAAPPRLYALRDKVVALRDMGMDWVWVMRFDGRLAAEEPEDFVLQRLCGHLRARHIVVGDDFRFGARRRGDLELLQSMGPERGFTAVGTRSFIAADQRVSSTAIREALQAGDFATAEMLLGHPYRMSGRVIYGQQLGRQLGFPTANIAIGHHRRAVNGVYRVWARLETDGERLPAIANVGIKPSFAHLGPLLEVHLLQHNLHLYGRPLTVEFIEKVRDARKFASLDQLKTQIHQDIATARAAFAGPED
ncbi:MAG: bifunctional riboflavin kinase/FAD synthetase [Natronospirillum sp.]|uniref:bifunctional riboflavin kinase/FAD synthetase n=1 Tax=Natronospirillum sp. TaxID=2812955 RepID=UPI0025F63DB0|nr:bifunctional riboflavin kinase/FAD synthetase [Natronospirillum sp.]MCH8550499.1 bifunctional riboflavin kinase/FAD synthetase [Natronospirillum sp.]